MTTEWVRASDEAFRALNELGEHRQRVAASPASAAARLFEKATLDLQLVGIARMFDPSGGNAFQTDRISLPICRELMARPGVMDILRADARRWPHGNPDQNIGDLDRRYDAFVQRLDRLDNEEPNRIAVLRAFRHENIAHELRLEPLPQRPLYRQVWEMVEELRDLVTDFSFVIDGINVFWPVGDISRSSGYLWTAVAER